MLSKTIDVPTCRPRRLAGLSLLVVVALSAGACQSSSSSSRLGNSAIGQSAIGQSSIGQSSIGQSSIGQSSIGQSSIGQSSIEQGSIKGTARAGQAWEADPGNIERGLAYAANLQAMGQVDDMIRVLDEVARRNPDDAKFQAYYGRQLTHHGRVEAGERVLRRLVVSGHADWRVHSALGSALDQQGKFSEARSQYDIALKSGAKKLTVLNNIGMSYMLEGNVKAAEDTFRQATALPGGDGEPRLRQNLALAVGLQGRFDEARDIASRDLPPDTVDSNMAYLRSMLSQPDTWQKLKPTAS